MVSSDFQTGGTWAGAVEALKAGWCPVFVRDGAAAPKGNRELMNLGAAPLPESDLTGAENLEERLRQIAKPKPQDLFG